jgi:hypothetical protein
MCTVANWTDAKVDLHSEGTIVHVIVEHDMIFTVSLRALHMEAELYNDRYAASTWVRMCTIAN